LCKPPIFQVEKNQRASPKRTLKSRQISCHAILQISKTAKNHYLGKNAKVTIITAQGWWLCWHTVHEFSRIHEFAPPIRVFAALFVDGLDATRTLLPTSL
jgi:hypothetical protein